MTGFCLVGEGFFLSAIGVYLVEIAPPDGAYPSFSERSLVIEVHCSSWSYIMHAATVWYVCSFIHPFLSGVLTWTRLHSAVTIGVTVGYFICYFSLSIPSSLSWRTPFIVQAGVSVVLGTGMAWMPFSPRWLFQNGRVTEAWQVSLHFAQVTLVQRANIISDSRYWKLLTDTLHPKKKRKSYLPRLLNGKGVRRLWELCKPLGIRIVGDELYWLFL